MQNIPASIFTRERKEGRKERRKEERSLLHSFSLKGTAGEEEREREKEKEREKKDYSIIRYLEGGGEGERK